LAYSFGLGKPVVSTPYWHARELLADGRGVLVPFGDAAAIGSEIAQLLTDDPRRQAMRERAYAACSAYAASLPQDTTLRWRTDIAERASKSAVNAALTPHAPSG